MESFKDILLLIIGALVTAIVQTFKTKQLKAEFNAKELENNIKLDRFVEDLRGAEDAAALALFNKHYPGK